MKRGLALASGGARGAYQAGALLYLAEQGVRFEGVAGTSIGALNGAFYVQGDGSPGHLERLCDFWRSIPELDVLKLDEKAVLSALATLAGGWLARIGGAMPVLFLARQLGVSVLDPRPLEEVLDDLLDYDAIRLSPRDFVIAVLPSSGPLLDLLKSPWESAEFMEARRLDAVSLREALLASAAIPLAFPAREIGGRRYSDAGLVAPLPAGELHRRGARLIVSIFLDDHTPLFPSDFPGTTLVQVHPSRVIETGLSSTFDFSRRTIESLIDLGYRDAREIYGEASRLASKLVELRRLGEENLERARRLPQPGDEPEPRWSGLPLEELEGGSPSLLPWPDED